MKILLVSSLLLLALCPPALAGSPAPTSTFGEAVEVNIVNVDVAATDSKGHRVTGLRKDDFELLEDGKRVPVSDFDSFDAGVGASQNRGTPASLGKASEEGFNLVIYFDDVNIRPGHRARVLKQLDEFLARQLAPGDRVMLVTDDMGLHVRVPFTSDSATLLKGLREVAALSAHGGESERDRRQTLDAILSIQRDSLTNSLNPIPCPQNIATPAHSFADARRQETLRAINTLTFLVNSLSGVPGRKVLLHVSDGLPLTPGEEVFEFLNGICGGGNAGLGRTQAPTFAQPNPGGPSINRNKPNGDVDPETVYDARSFGVRAYQASSQAALDAQTYSVARNLQALAAHANAHRVTLYTLQAADPGGNAASDSGFGPDERLYQFPSIGSSERANNRDSLQLLADNTGGRSILDANDLLPDLARMREDLASFYSLGFTSAHPGDGREHRIEVRVSRPGVSLRYRESYRDKPAIERVVDRTLATLFYGFEENPLGVTVEVGEPVATKGGEYAVPLRLKIPLFKLALLNRDETYSGKLRFLVATRDETGGTSTVHQVQVPLHIPHKEVLSALGQYYLYTLTVQMKPGTQHFAVAVQDELAASTSYLSRPVTVAATAAMSYP